MSDTTKGRALDLKAAAMTPTPIKVTEDMLVELPNGMQVMGKDLIALGLALGAGAMPADICPPYHPFTCSKMNSVIRDPAIVEKAAVLATQFAVKDAKIRTK